MMGYSHALSGVVVGCCAVALSPIPGPVATLVVLLAGGAALLPDIDHPSSTVAHSLGPVTGVISRLVDRFALTVYHSTRTPLDPADRESGHRLITHTPVGALGFGAIATVACAVSPWGAALCCGLIIGLLAGATKRITRKLLKVLVGVRTGSGLLIAGASGGLAYWVSEMYPGWWWLYGVSVAVGCHVHREGDWCTNSGVPRRSWPRLKNGHRWDKDRAPATFKTGEATEVFVVQRLLLGATVVSAAWATGVLAPVLGTVWPLVMGWV